MSDYNDDLFDEYSADMLESLCNTPKEQIKLGALAHIVKKYDIYEVLTSISALNLFPDNQNKSDLFDAAIMALLSKPYGTYRRARLPDSNLLQEITRQISRLEARVRVDPVENVFVDRIMFGDNYLVLPGINPEPAYTMQMLIYTLMGLWNELGAVFHTAASNILRTALTISDTIVRNQQAQLFEVCHVENATITVPDTDVLSKARSNLVFDRNYVDSLLQGSLALDDCLTTFESFDINKILDNSSETLLIQRPFIAISDEQIAVLNPTLLIPFAIHHVLAIAEQHGASEKLFTAYNQRVWKHCRQSLSRLGHVKLDTTQFDIDLTDDEHLKEVLLASSNDGIMLCQFVCDSGEMLPQTGLYSQITHTYSGEPLVQRAVYFRRKLQDAGMAHYVHVVIHNSLARHLRFGLHKQFDKGGIVLTPFQLSCISINEHQKDWFLSRYILSKAKVKTFSSAYSNELDTIALYSENNESFYSADDVDYRKAVLYFAFGSAVEYVAQALRKEDRQLVDIGEDRYYEVILHDALRGIYVAAHPRGKRIEICVKLEEILLWLRPNEAKSLEEINIYNSLVDGISYWLAECKIALHEMQFISPFTVLNIVIEGDINDYYRDKQTTDELHEHISFYTVGNTITMTWTANAWRCFRSSPNNAEFDMIMSILEELKQFCRYPVKRSLVESVFANPRKKKFFSLDVEEHPYFKPIYEPAVQIRNAEVDALLDEIGEHFLSMPEWKCGTVTDTDRGRLCNSIVGYLYSRLQQEVAALKPDTLFNRVCYDLEATMYNMMLDRKRYAFDIACYPEKENEHRVHHNAINKASLALKFLAEYISASPPNGDKELGELCYARILAICSAIIEWAYMNDLFYYKIVDSTVSFLPSGRIGINREHEDRLYDANTAAQITQLTQLSDPSVDCFSPTKSISEILPLLDEAFEDEFGYSHTSFAKCIYALIALGDTMPGEVKRAPYNEVTRKVANLAALPEDDIQRVLAQITLTQREDYLTPNKPYRREDVYPWRFNRQLSFARRPIMHVFDDLIWGNRQLYHMMLYTLDLIANGKFQARSDKLKSLIGTLCDKRGAEFNAVVAQKLQSVEGVVLKTQVKKINGLHLADEKGKDYGDIDVLFAIPATRTIVVGEVKDFSLVKNPYEMYQEYKAIFVDDGKKLCYLSKHKRRVAWVQTHLADTLTYMGLCGDDWVIKDVMIVSSPIVSSSFYDEKQRIIVFSDITFDSLNTI